MSDEEILESDSLLKTALAIALEDVARLNRERDEALLIHQTDTGTESAVAALQDENAALLWVLWHHQGSSSPVGQPIRFALGMDAHARLNESQVTEAKRWAAMTQSTTDEFHNRGQRQNSFK